MSSINKKKDTSYTYTYFLSDTVFRINDIGVIERICWLIFTLATPKISYWIDYPPNGENNLLWYLSRNIQVCLFQLYHLLIVQKLICFEVYRISLIMNSISNHDEHNQFAFRILSDRQKFHHQFLIYWKSNFWESTVVFFQDQPVAYLPEVLQTSHW